MTLRVPFRFKSLLQPDVPQLNRTLSRVYETKLESLYHRSGTSIQALVFQSQETGNVTFSANGSPVVVQTFAFAEKQGKVLFANAHAMSSEICAHITDVTQSQIEITCRPISGTANFSDITTASVRVYFHIIGANP
jgi:hypothetical protein